jgi:hypothetical protein
MAVHKQKKAQLFAKSRLSTKDDGSHPGRPTIYKFKQAGEWLRRYSTECEGIDYIKVKKNAFSGSEAYDLVSVPKPLV